MSFEAEHFILKSSFFTPHLRHNLCIFSVAFPGQLGFLYVVWVRVGYIVLPCWGGEGRESGDDEEDTEDLETDHLPSPYTRAGGAEV